MLEQLPLLLREGVIDAASAERLRQHYAPIATTGDGHISRLLFAALGAILVGLGLILLAAHNWGDWSRGMRLGVSLVPLLLSQVAVYTVLRKPRTEAFWREPTAAFCALAFALALAMVGQIFHLPGDLGAYLLTCAALALPLVYLLHSGLAAMLYGAAVLAAVAADAPFDRHPLVVVAAFALLGPFLRRNWREHPLAARTVLPLIALLPMLFAAVLMSLADTSRLGLWWLAVFGALLVMLDARFAPTASSLWRRPLAAYGTLAVAVAALLGSFAEAWRGIPPSASASLAQAWLLLFSALGFALWLAVAAARQRHWSVALQVLPAVLMSLLVVFDTRPWAPLLAWLLSAVVLVIALAMLREGLHDRHWGAATRGLFLICMLVLLRFLDGDWSFTVRGLVFVITGAAFLAASLWLRRRMA